MTIVLSVLGALLTFTFLIFIHELGHFTAAKAFKVPVREFAIGMGPTIFSFKKKETKYALRAIPLGGFCNMVGEDEEAEEESALYKQAKWKRIVILAAGGFMNLLSGLILCIVIVSFSSEVVPSVVSTVFENSPAAVSGIQEGDRITKIDNAHININNDIILKLIVSGEKTVDVTVVRDGNKLTFPVTPTLSNETGRYVLGIESLRVPNSFLNTIKFGYYEFFSTSQNILDFLGALITGHFSPALMSGPVGIVSEIGGAVGSVVEQKSVGSWLNFLYLFALISINLGLFNLLPVPALDGGRIIFVLVEAIRRKKINPEVEGIVHLVGFALLIALVIYATTNDISRLIS